ncbi:MAG: hypothetical protein ACK4IX_05080 [Candidatus Sericytochromatia bacterium]
MEEKYTIVLARPHPKISEYMSNAIDNSGFIPYKIESEDSFENIDMTKVKGFVISTSISSSVKEKPVDLYIRLKNIYPHTPILFTTTGDKNTIGKVLSLSLKLHLKNSDVIFSDIENYKYLESKKIDFLLLSINDFTSNHKDIIPHVLKDFFLT